MFVRFSISLLLFSLCASFGTAQSSLPRDEVRPIDTVGISSGQRWANTITPDELRIYAYALAADSMQGRETGTEGQRMAAQYLSQQIQGWGLPRMGEDYSYTQKIAFERLAWDSLSFLLSGRAFKPMKDFYAYREQNQDFSGDIDKVIFLGYGIETGRYSDYDGQSQLKGEVGVVLAGEPFDKNGNSYITGTPDSSAWSQDIDLKIQAAKRAGLRALLVVDPVLQKSISANRSKLIEEGLRVADATKAVAEEADFNLLFISPNMFRELLGRKKRKVIRARKRIAKRGDSRAVSIPTDINIEARIDRFRLEGENVLAYIHGSDPAVADEVVVISAHYDHLGMRGDDIFNGADDNASGTSTVLEITEAFVEAAKAGQAPRRSVLLLFVSGEEKGLLGSKFYAENPKFPLDKTVANINIDMIGRYDEAHSDSTKYVYVIGDGKISPDLQHANQAINNTTSKIDFDYLYDAEEHPMRIYYRSDHYSFAKNGIPAVFFFSGLHEDYHRPTDTPDKLDYKKMAAIGKHAFLLGWNLANRAGTLNRK